MDRRVNNFSPHFISNIFNYVLIQNDYYSQTLYRASKSTLISPMRNAVVEIISFIGGGGTGWK